MKAPSVSRVAADVAQALRARQPVVALETTVVTHGLPRPLGLAVAREMEQAVRSEGAVPATIGVLGGGAVVGLSAPELEQLASTADAAKLNLGNLAARIASGEMGSTTVAATLLLARRAGIRVLATGGIGGVHRGAAVTGDVSGDMTALARFPVAVVCSGAKSVLDLPRTVELLETLGVPIFGFGTDRFPAFYRRDSGLAVDYRFDSVAELARALEVHFALGTGAALVASPVPAEHELDQEAHERPLAEALAAAERQGVRGRAVTPFVLEQLRRLTEDRSVATNRALLLANARLAARLAVALSEAGGETR